MQIKAARVISQVVPAVLLSLVLVSCGGGGGGASDSAGRPVPIESPRTTVSGVVQTPGGQVALNASQTLRTRLARLFMSSAYADISGLSNVPDGTAVELIRADIGSGAPVAVIATTTTRGGRYSFNLTQLGQSYSSTLIARLEAGTGVQLRAFVTSDSVNIDPSSEAAVQLVLDEIARTPGSSLEAFTPGEVENLAASIEMLTGASGPSAAPSVSATVEEVKRLAASKSLFRSYLSISAAPGEAAHGPGDIGNYFPIAVGDAWTYRAPGGPVTESVART